MAMRKLIESERGAIAALMAILLGSGALIAVLALAVDFGRVYLEQQVLRNASSSAALALAEACSQELASCQNLSSAETLVQSYLNANSPDGQSKLLELCGDSPLPACLLTSQKPSACKNYLGSNNLVRVIASSRENSVDSMSLFFTNQDSIELAQCSQAEWASGPTATGSVETSVDMGFPICDYLPAQQPVVWFQFRNQQLNPDVPREKSCQLTLSSGEVAFTDVSNGIPGLDINVGACDQSVTLDFGQIVQLGKTNFKQLCDKEIEAFLDSAISNETEVPVALMGSFVRYSSGHYDFEIAGKTSIRFLGYRLSGNTVGGAEPPGGWDAYPEGVPSNETCSAARPCFYGYYVTEPEFANTQPMARLVFE